jgi:hypothetical protein
MISLSLSLSPPPLQGTSIPEVIAEAQSFHWEFIDAKLDHTYITILVSKLVKPDNVTLYIGHIKTFSTGRRVIVSQLPSFSLDHASLLP